MDARLTSHRHGSQIDEMPVVDRLEMDIIFGRLHPRERIREDDLMARFDLKRHRARQVIQELVGRGFAVREPNKSATVRSHTSPELRELYEIRNTLQTAAIDRMELPVGADTLSVMRDAHFAHIRAAERSDPVGILVSNETFHSAFFDACGNGLLARAIADYAGKTDQVRSRGFHDRSYLEDVQAEHALIIEAAETGDRAQLVSLSTEHTNRPRNLYLRGLGEL